jgi:hypothetical protein
LLTGGAEGCTLSSALQEMDAMAVVVGNNSNLVMHKLIPTMRKRITVYISKVYDLSLAL